MTPLPPHQAPEPARQPTTTQPTPRQEVEDHTSEQTRTNAGGRDSGVGPVTGEGNLVLVSPQGPLHISMSGSGSGPEVMGDVTPAHDTETDSHQPRKDRPRRSERERSAARQKTNREQVRQQAARRHQEDEQRLIQQAAAASGRTEREVREELESLARRVRGTQQGDVTPPQSRTQTGKHATADTTPVHVVGDGHITVTQGSTVTRSTRTRQGGVQ
jgi:hypothetical protein